MSAEVLQKGNTSESEESDSDDFCPALPPHLLKPKIIGPTLPPGMTDAYLTDLATVAKNVNSDEIFASIPVKQGGLLTAEERHALLMKDSPLIKQQTDIHTRESWMTDLPEEKSKLAIFGLGTRKFASRPALEKGDQSCWTDSPAEKEKKKTMEPKTKKRRKSASPDHEEESIGKMVETYNEIKRPDSLVDMHCIKKKKAEPAVKERKPFSREEDLKVNKFDNAQRASILKKAQQLDDRFSKGSKKYL